MKQDTASSRAGQRLTGADGTLQRLRIEFLTPTELKSNAQIVEHPEFPILLGRIRYRISTLRAIYGSGPMAIDFGACASARAG